jgi:mRNA interferase MazF
MNPGDVVLSRVQQSDGRLKSRPAVVLSILPPYQDRLICGISSKVRHEVVGFDDLILTTDADFPLTGLKLDSLIRLGLIATIPSSAIVGTMGSITPERLTRLQRRLADHLSPRPTTPQDETITSGPEGANF